MYPEDLKYSKEHEWVRVEDGLAVIGITDFAQDKLGDVVFVELPDKGAEFKAMEEFGVVESVKTVSPVYCPVSGKVTAINKDLITQPELINDDPHGKGWMIKIKMKNPAELDKLLSAEEYQLLLEEPK